MRPTLDKQAFLRCAEAERGRGGVPVIPVGVRLLSDQLTPVLAYRRLVTDDPREAPSFLLESVEGGDRQGRFSVVGAHPALELIATRDTLIRRDLRTGSAERTHTTDPLGDARAITKQWRLVRPSGAGPRDPLPPCVLGGWFGYASYDSVRYAEPDKLGWATAPRDDRNLPDVQFSLYDRLVIFDHATKIVHVVCCVPVPPGADAGALYDGALQRLAQAVAMIQVHARPLPSGELLDERDAPARAPASNMTRADHEAMVAKAQQYIRAGDIFQVVVGQRFERISAADPFDVYRALRVVNPSPYMAYMQAAGCILVASSPEILCRVRREEAGLRVTNRPLAGTRRRGASAEEDARLEAELRADAKERAEHVMLVDLGRNDVGVVAAEGTVRLESVMDVERYSHVMHLSSTVTGLVRPGLDAWDALRAALPVGTISGAPKIRAMQIIDELEPIRRGPYGGGFGYVDFAGEMDIALALRTIVVPTAQRAGATWPYHIQAAGGIVFDSVPADEYQETVNKAAALHRAIDLAEHAFGTDQT
jgi:anthranilate synthase component 1